MMSPKRLLILVFAVVSPFLTGCQMGRGTFMPGSQEHYKFEELMRHPPQNRMGTLASNPVVTVYSKSAKLGRHGYRPNGSEQNGMIYTCTGGHIDLAHLRNVADWTGYLASKSYFHISKENDRFSFSLGDEGKCYVGITYPSSWDHLTEDGKSRVTKEISSRLGEYLAYQFSIWHEMVTWFGYKSTGIYSEYKSAFSWEDTYSNLLGSRIGYAALMSDAHCFSEGVTEALKDEMQLLGIQQVKVAKEAARQIRSRQCKDLIPYANIKLRNFDIGLSDGQITPWVIPTVGSCENVSARSYCVPTLDFLETYGFSIKFRIEPKVWEKKRILRIAFGRDYKESRFLDPDEGFEKIMAYIEQEAISKYGLFDGRKAMTQGRP
jgi:hypothetical protein